MKVNSKTKSRYMSLSSSAAQGPAKKARRGRVAEARSIPGPTSRPLRETRPRRARRAVFSYGSEARAAVPEQPRADLVPPGLLPFGPETRRLVAGTEGS